MTRRSLYALTLSFVLLAAGAHAQISQDPAPLPPAELTAEESAALESANILDSIFTRLYQRDRRSHNITYSLTGDNALVGNWLVQTPFVWDKASNEVPHGAGAYVGGHLTELIASAERHIDIMTLVPFPTGDFQLAIRRGLERLATSGRPVTVRILAGWDPLSVSEMNQHDYLVSLIVDIKDRGRFPNNRLQISVGANRTAAPHLTWNHAKIVAIDGKEMLIGGQNFWQSDYLRDNPVHDVSLRLKGSATALGHRFADVVWQGPCQYIRPDWLPALWRAGGNVTTGCLSRPPSATFPPPGNVRMLMVGRLGVDRVFTVEASEAAMEAAFDLTSGPLLLAQQDFMGTPFWDWTKPIIKEVIQWNRPVFLVVGDDHSKAGPPPGKAYKWPGRTLDKLVLDLWNEGKAQRGSMTIPALKDRLCNTLRVAPLRFGPSKKWPDGTPIANHSKVWLAGNLFYVGSHNLYPAGLQELGVIVEDARHVGVMRSEYWDKLWKWSRVDAVSGVEATKPCAFRNLN